MSLWDVIAGRDANAEQAIRIARDLAQVSVSEDTNLALHTQLCARRFGTLVTLIEAGINNSRQNRALLIVVIATLLLTKVVTVDMITGLFKTFLG